MIIDIKDESSTYYCEFVPQGDGTQRLWIVETGSIDGRHLWFPTFSKYCKHKVLNGECINCSLVIEED